MNSVERGRVGTNDLKVCLTGICGYTGTKGPFHFATDYSVISLRLGVLLARKICSF